MTKVSSGFLVHELSRYDWEAMAQTMKHADVRWSDEDLDMWYYPSAHELHKYVYNWIGKFSEDNYSFERTASHVYKGLRITLYQNFFDEEPYSISVELQLTFNTPKEEQLLRAYDI